MSIPGIRFPRNDAAQAESHGDGGLAEINVEGLSGLLADPQTPLAHATTHQNNGADEINVTGLSGLLADPQASLAVPTGGTKGLMLVKASSVDYATEWTDTLERAFPQFRLKADGAGGGRGFYLLDGGTPTKYNWMFAAQQNLDNAIEITPSTAVGGMTFTTPLVLIHAVTGLITFGAGVNVVGALAAASVAAAAAVTAAAVNVTGAFPQIRVIADGATGTKGIYLMDGGGTPVKYNWLIGANHNVDALEITASTVVGGTTFTTPLFVMYQSGTVYFLGEVNVAALVKAKSIILNDDSGPLFRLQRGSSAPRFDTETDGTNAIFRAQDTGHFMFAQLLTPETTAAVDLGSPSLKWRDFYLSRNASIAGDLTADTLHGDGAVPEGGAAGDVLTKVDGSDFNVEWAAPAGGSGIPTDPIASPTGHYKADSLALSDGDPVSTWEDEGSSNFDLTAASTVRPTYKAGDDGDSLPYIDFDGSDDGLVYLGGGALYSSGTITIYGVVKAVGQDLDGLATFGRLSGYDTNFDGGLLIRADTGYYSIYRNSVRWSPVVGNITGNGYIPDLRKWSTFCTRFAVLNGRAVVTTIFGKSECSIDLGTSLTNFGFEVLSVGCSYSGGGLSNWSKCQWREYLWYTDSHSDAQIRHNLQYLANKWATLTD